MMILDMRYVNRDGAKVLQHLTFSSPTHIDDDGMMNFSIKDARWQDVEVREEYVGPEYEHN